MTVTEPARAASAPPAPSTPYTHRQIMVILSGLMLGLLLAALDQTIVSTALTTISRDFGRLDLYSWVITAYLLTSTASTPLYGKISDQFGRKKVFEVAIVIFLAGSALSGLSQSMYQLIIFRGVQGLGAGGLLTLAFAIIGDVIPPRERGRYQGYFGAVFGVASVIGPLVGGFLVDQASWRWVFYVNIPIGVVALLVINRVLQLDHHYRKSKMDLLGAFLIVSGVSLFLVGVQDAGSGGQDHHHLDDVRHSRPPAHRRLRVVGDQGGGADHPAAVVPQPRLYRRQRAGLHHRHGDVRGAHLPAAVLPAGQGHQPTLSGLRLLPMLAGLLLLSITSGRLVSRLGRYKVFVVTGTGVLAVGLLWMTTIALHTSGWILAGMLFVVGAGLGMFMQTLVLAVQNSIPYEYMGTGTAAVTFFRTLGGAIGAAVMGAVLLEQETTTTAHYVAEYGAKIGPLQAFTHGMDKAFIYAVPVAVVAFAASFLMRDVRLRRAVGTVVRGGEPEAGEAGVVNDGVVGGAGGDGREGGPAPALEAPFG